MSTYDATTDTLPSSFKAGDIINVPYSGAAITIPLRKGTYTLEVWGAQGGYRSSSTYGGLGGYSVGTLTLASASTLYAYAGGSGSTGGTSGGYNGGGRRSTYAGGGGGSDFRIGSTSLYARVIVAGGGGSDGSSARAGGVGGGSAGGSYSGSGYGTNNGPGTATYSGSSSSTTASTQSTSVSSSTDIYGGFGFGGNGVYRSSGYGGAGGGGWYGGSGTYPDGSADDDKAGCGGSGYVYTSSAASSYPSGCLLDSSHYLTDASTVAGSSSFTSPSGSSETGHSGNGYCRITVVEAGVTATWVADGVTVRTDTLDEGDTLSAPDVTKQGYTVAWSVDGVVVDLSTYTMPGSDTTFTAVYTPLTYAVVLHDQGEDTSSTVSYGSYVTLPTEGSDSTRTLRGWWDGSTIQTGAYYPTADVTLLACYRNNGSKLTVDSVSCQPNPVEAGSVVLLSVLATSVDLDVPDWSGFVLTASNGLPMSSVEQATMWDTTDSDAAVFEGPGIPTAGAKFAPPLEAVDGPSPRVAVWSSGVSSSDGSASLTLTGTVGTEVTSSVVMRSSPEAYVTEATITYSDGTSHTMTSESSIMTFPSGTYTSFAIVVTKVSEEGRHVRILEISPGGAQ